MPSAGPVTLGWSGDGSDALLVLASYGLTDPPGGGAAGGGEHYAYGPFGEGSDAGNGTIAYRYAGQRFDPETGLYYMRARYYSVKAGRFLSPDPIGYDDGPNIYAYVGNNPINFIDPLGLACVCGDAPNRAMSGYRSARDAEIVAAIALTAVSVFPIAGELMDGYVAVDFFGQYSTAERALAAASLGVNATTGGVAPNAGPLIIFGAKVIGKHADEVSEIRPFAMGADQHLDEFAELHGASTWKDFEDAVNWQPQVLEKLADSDQRVLFNLDGVDVWPGAQRAAAGRGGALDWELLQIQQNPGFPKLEFWKGGNKVRNPFE